MSKPVFLHTVRFKRDELPPCFTVPSPLWEYVRGSRVTLVRPDLPATNSTPNCDTDTWWLVIKSPEIVKLFNACNAEIGSRDIVACRHVLDIGD